MISFSRSEAFELNGMFVVALTRFSFQSTCRVMKFVMSLKQAQVVLIDNNRPSSILANDAPILNLAYLDKFSEKFYVLTPLDVNLVFEKCIYQEGGMLPDLKVAGELPMLDFKLTDSKLENIINLLLSIPYPVLNDFSNLGLFLYDC